MQAGPPPEDLHSILGRFQNWFDNQPPGHGNGSTNGGSAEGIREIPYEEAIRKHRSRQAAPSQRRPANPKPANPKPKATAAGSQPAAKPANTGSVSPSEPQTPLPPWVANLPVVPDSEPVIELKAAATPPEASGGKVLAAPPRAATRSVPATQRVAKPVGAKQSPATDPKTKSIEEALLDALPGLPAHTFVDLPAAGLSRRSKPQRRAVSSATTSPQPKIPVAAVETSPPVKQAASAAPPPAPVIKAKPPAIAAKTAPQTAPISTPRSAQPTGRVAIAKSVIVRSPSKMAPPLPSRPAIHRKASTASTTRQKSRPRKRPPFRNVLASTVQQPKAVLASRNKPAPDRTRRITTRFSPAEERRIEKCAAELGITVSAYLRQCALASIAQKPLQEIPASPASVKTRKPQARYTEEPMQYTGPAQPSLLGGWLSLLRNRFLGPPVRFSQDT